MLKKLLVAGAAASLAVAGVSAALTPVLAASGTPSGGECQLSGSATFSPNGPGTAATFGYSVEGTLSGCESNAASPPSGGTLAVGQTIVEKVTLSTSTGSEAGTAQYRQAAASGQGSVPGNSCAAGTTSGTGIVTWNDNTLSVVSYKTTSVGPAVPLQGSVVPSQVLSLVARSESVAGTTAPATYTVVSNNTSFPVGDSIDGLVAFTTSNPAGCTTAAGLSSVGLTGVLGVGSA